MDNARSPLGCDTWHRLGPGQSPSDLHPPGGHRTLWRTAGAAPEHDARCCGSLTVDELIPSHCSGAHGFLTPQTELQGPRWGGVCGPCSCEGWCQGICATRRWPDAAWPSLTGLPPGFPGLRTFLRLGCDYGMDLSDSAFKPDSFAFRDKIYGIW